MNPTQSPTPGTEREASYEKIDRFLRNNLDDSDYAEYSAALENVSAPPLKQWEPEFCCNSLAQEELALQFCAEIAGKRGEKGSPPDPVRLLEMAEALYQAERDAFQPPPSQGEPDMAKDAARYRWLREQHEGQDSGETLCVFEPDYGAHCLQPVGSMPGELDAAIDSSMAAAKGEERAAVEGEKTGGAIE